MATNLWRLFSMLALEMLMLTQWTPSYVILIWSPCKSIENQAHPQQEKEGNCHPPFSRHPCICINESKQQINMQKGYSPSYMILINVVNCLPLSLSSLTGWWQSRPIIARTLKGNLGANPTRRSKGNCDYEAVVIQVPDWRENLLSNNVIIFTL